MVDVQKLTKKRLGELLREEGVIGEEEIQEALNKQQESGDLLGKILIDLGHTSETEIANVLCKQFGLPYVNVMNYYPTREAIDSIPVEFMIEHRVLPIDRIGEVVVVAVSCYFTEELFERIMELIDGELQVVVTQNELLDQALEKHLEIDPDVLTGDAEYRPEKQEEETEEEPEPVPENQMDEPETSVEEDEEKVDDIDDVLESEPDTDVKLVSEEEEAEEDAPPEPVSIDETEESLESFTNDDGQDASASEADQSIEQGAVAEGDELDSSKETPQPELKDGETGELEEDEEKEEKKEEIKKEKEEKGKAKRRSPDDGEDDSGDTSVFDWFFSEE